MLILLESEANIVILPWDRIEGLMNFEVRVLVASLFYSLQVLYLYKDGLEDAISDN